MNIIGTKDNRYVRYTHVLHGARILTSNCPNKITKFCSEYTMHGAYGYSCGPPNSYKWNEKNPRTS